MCVYLYSQYLGAVLHAGEAGAIELGQRGQQRGHAPGAGAVVMVTQVAGAVVVGRGEQGGVVLRGVGLTEHLHGQSSAWDGRARTHTQEHTHTHT